VLVLMSVGLSVSSDSPPVLRARFGITFSVSLLVCVWCIRRVEEPDLPATEGCTNDAEGVCGRFNPSLVHRSTRGLFVTRRCVAKYYSAVSA
jgi:hypothetical protein